MTKVTLNNINKIYPGGKHAVRDVSVSAEPGEFLVLVGPSGCGKTSLLRMIAGLEEATSGEIYFDSTLVNDFEPKKRDIGMVFQNYALYPHLSVFDNIAFPLSIRGEKKTDIKKRVEEVAALIGLSSSLATKPSALSGGERQRVALGRAIVRRPRLFLFDEPLSNLDAKLRVAMRTEIMSLQRRLNVTSVYVTHDQVEAMTMGDRIAVMSGGRILQCDAPERLYNEPANVFVASFLGSPQINLFEGELIQRDGLAFKETGGSISFNFPPASFNFALKGNQKITLGLRPEKIRLDARNSPDEINFTSNVVNVEYLGSERFAYFQGASALKCMRADATREILLGERKFYFNINDLLFFDSKGERL
ncbi:MAG: ABC transporter ATP-binding protein [Chloroflexota bacterium]